MMESSNGPTASEAAAALREAEAARDALAGAAVPSRSLFTLLACAVAAQIATTAVGLGADRPVVLIAGLAVFALVVGVELLRLRRASGIWVGGFVSRVVLGTDTRASLAYTAALGAAIWAAFASQWWLVALCSVAGGVAYALSGRRWLARYHDQPGVHARAGGSLPELIALATVALGLLVLLAAGR